MKKLLSAIVLFCFLYNCSAQTDTIKRVSVNDLNKTFARVVKEAQFPGGQRGWITFLQENLEYPAKARRKKIEGTVVVTFMINKDGTISDIQVASGPEELREAATNVIKKSPNWIPASQDGKKVRSYKKQPVNFSIQ